MLVFPYSFYVEFFSELLVYQIFGLFTILSSDPQLDPTDQIRPKPVKTNDILITQKAFNARGIKNTFSDEGVR